MHFIRHHKSRIKSQSKMPYNLIRIALVLIFLNKIRSAGKSDLIDILLHFLRSHPKAVIRHSERFLLRINHHVYPGTISVRQRIFPNHIQLLQFRHGITAIGDQLPVKDVVVLIIGKIFSLLIDKLPFLEFLPSIFTTSLSFYYFSEPIACLSEIKFKSPKRKCQAKISTHFKRVLITMFHLLKNPAFMRFSGF